MRKYERKTEGPNSIMSESDVELLKEIFNDYSLPELERIFPEMATGSVRTRASALGLNKRTRVLDEDLRPGFVRKSVEHMLALRKVREAEYRQGELERERERLLVQLAKLDEQIKMFQSIREKYAAQL